MSASPWIYQVASCITGLHNFWGLASLITVEQDSFSETIYKDFLGNEDQVSKKIQSMIVSNLYGIETYGPTSLCKIE